MEPDFELESKWIDENREQYKGKWVALCGNNFLAAGDSAREVYREARKYTVSPLVIFVEKLEDAATI